MSLAFNDYSLHDYGGVIELLYALPNYLCQQRFRSTKAIRVRKSDLLPR
jgi:hypothetical protein